MKILIQYFRNTPETFVSGGEKARWHSGVVHPRWSSHGNLWNPRKISNIIKNHWFSMIINILTMLATPKDLGCIEQVTGPWKKRKIMFKPFGTLRKRTFPRGKMPADTLERSIHDDRLMEIYWILGNLKCPCFFCWFAYYLILYVKVGDVGDVGDI